MNKLKKQLFILEDSCVSSKDEFVNVKINSTH